MKLTYFESKISELRHCFKPNTETRLLTGT